MCPHGRHKAYCKECGGNGLCSHGRQKSYCKPCGGGGICDHGRRRSLCEECKKTKTRAAAAGGAGAGAAASAADLPTMPTTTPPPPLPTSQSAGAPPQPMVMPDITVAALERTLGLNPTDAGSRDIMRVAMELKQRATSALVAALRPEGVQPWVPGVAAAVAPPTADV